MPIQVKYLDKGLGVLFIGAGVLTGEDIINSNKVTFYSEEKMKDYKYGLMDYSSISSLDATNAEIQTMISQQKEASKFIPDGVLAIVATKDIGFGLSRMWEMMAESEDLQWESKVFRNREDAVAWIRERVRDKFGIVDLKFV